MLENNMKSTKSNFIKHKFGKLIVQCIIYLTDTAANQAKLLHVIINKRPQIEP